MVPTTWSALLVLLVAVLPGAMFTFGFERQAGAFGVTLADRVLRFVAVSAAFGVLYAWPAYWVHSGVDPPWTAREFALVWAALVAGLCVPAAGGTLVGGLYATRGTRAGWPLVRALLSAEGEARLLRWVLGRDPAPRAWDHHFAQRPYAYLRVRTRDDTWVGGLFADNSFAGRFPQAGDLLIEDAWAIDESGMFRDGPLGYAVYVPAESVSFVEIVPAPEREERHG